MDVTEKWRAVVGYEGLYEVSNLGRVRSLDRRVAFGNQTRLVIGRILRPGASLQGVPFVMLTDGPRRKAARVHQVVLEAFVGPKPPGLVGCHWNDIKTDNRVENLRWDTMSANSRDKVRNGHDHNASKTHCLRGHEFTDENTYHGRKGRFCRACKSIKTKAAYHADLEANRIKSRESMRRRRQAKREAERQ